MSAAAASPSTPIPLKPATFIERVPPRSNAAHAVTFWSVGYLMTSTVRCNYRYPTFARSDRSSVRHRQARLR